MLEVKELKKYYKTKGGIIVRALDGVSIKFPETGMVFLLGKSGSGKSTLLNVSGGLDKPDSGEIIVKGKSSKDFTQADFDSYRNTYVGFIFQEYNILNEFNVETNIALALELQGKKSDNDAVENLLKQVDLSGLGKRKPNTLSGGQKQRIAIARALIKEPEIIMADEPTGALDSVTGKQVFDTLKKLSETKLVIIVSHDREFAEDYADRIIELKDGKILSDVSKHQAEPDSLSENVRKIGEGTIQIKEASKLSDAEIAEIIKQIKGDGEIIISKNDNNVARFKKAAKITDAGTTEYFKDTKPEDVVIKEYDGSKTEFIKSSLPLKHGFRMGASSLKIKPGRLVLTMLLSIIAFTLFGTSSTLMLYDPAYSYAEAIAAESYQALKINKQYTKKVSTYRIDSEGNSELDYEYEDYYDTFVSKNDITSLNDNYLNLDFAGYYETTVDFSSCLEEESDLPYYGNTSFYALCDCGEEYLNRQGFSLLSGKYPTNDNEIAISDYVFEIFKECSYYNPSTRIKKEISTYSDLTGLTLPLRINCSSGLNKNIEFTISGIYAMDNPYNDEKYSILKEKDRSEYSSTDLNNLENSFKDVYKSSFFGMAFISETFYENNKTYLKQSSFDDYYEYLDYTYAYGLNFLDSDSYELFKTVSNKDEYYPYDEYSGVDVFLTSDVDKEKLTFIDLEGNIVDDISSLEMDEVYLEGNNYFISDAFMNLIQYPVNSKRGICDRNGEFSYITLRYPDGSEPIYVNYSNFDMKSEYVEGYEETGNVLLDDDGKIVLYSLCYYTDIEKTEYKEESDEDFFLPVTVFFTTSGECVGELSTIGAETFYYDESTGKIYLQKDVTWDVNKQAYVLKSNHDLVLKWFASGYELDATGKPIETEYGNGKIGLFIDTTTGEPSLTKKPNSLFASEYYTDKNGKVYIGTLTNRFYYRIENDVKIYSFDNEFLPLGSTATDIYMTNIETHPEAIGALLRYYYQYKDSYAMQKIIDAIPNYDVENALKKPYKVEDVKYIAEALDEFYDSPHASSSSYKDNCAITTYSGRDYEMKVKGFFFVKNSFSNYANIVLADGWKNRIIYPDDYFEDEYTWIRVFETDYVVDENAQYSGAITLSDRTIQELNFMMQKYNDGSFYNINNKVASDLSWITSLLLELKIIFLVAGIVTAIFSGLMLFNFISTSISHKKKEIGILRAVGARGIDVFKIFFSESAIICGICFVISSFVSAATCSLLDKEIAGALAFKVFNFGLINIAVILGVSLIVGLVGTIFPVISASKKPPVESIRSL